MPLVSDPQSSILATDQTPAPRAVPRSMGATLAALGLVIVVANGGLLVLQLVAGRVLAPFIGSSLETWTAVIGVFLTGIAAGNWVGAGRRFAAATWSTLAAVLLAGMLAALWMIALPEVLHRTGWQAALPLGSRIIILSAITCFPAGLILALLTPLAVRLGTADVRSAGRVAGMTFALGTFGCLVGNYATGFWLIPSLNVNSIIAGVAVSLAVLATAIVILPMPKVRVALPQDLDSPLPPLGRAFAIVFLCSFAGMSLELAGVRVMAQIVGVSLFTWTGVIGVMLAGTATGNWLGGVIADRANRRGSDAAHYALASSLIWAGAAAAMVIGLCILSQGTWFESLAIMTRIILWSFTLFFAPMLLLGTISPQVIRLTVPNVEQAGAIAGRVYAVSTLGAIVGTFATGFVLIAELGAYRVVLTAALLPLAASFVILRLWDRSILLYLATMVAGASVGGLYLFSPERTKIARESNYFTIQVKPARDEFLARQGVHTLQLDLLVHSWVKPDDPTFLFYAHERTQLEVLRNRAERIAEPRVLVIGGGAYTFPRAVRTLLPQCPVDVVEIDPAVTEVTYERLFLDPKLGITSFHMDGRQFVAERTKPGTYHVVTMDAVNDLSVPSHLLTKEFNDRVRGVLAPEGAYLVSVIDQPDIGKVLPAVIHTLKQTFPHVELLSPNTEWSPQKQTVFVVYAAEVPFDEGQFRQLAERTARDPRVAAGGGLSIAALPWHFSNRPPAGELDKLLTADAPILLTDQYAPVDWLMADVFRRRQTSEGK
jgi:spermidine synthase